MGLFGKKNKKDEHPETSHYDPVHQSEGSGPYGEATGYNQPGYSSQSDQGAYSTSSGGNGQQQQYDPNSYGDQPVGGMSQSSYDSGGKSYGQTSSGTGRYSNEYPQSETGYGSASTDRYNEAPHGSSSGYSNQGQSGYRQSSTERIPRKNQKEEKRRSDKDRSYGSSGRHSDNYGSGGQGYGGNYSDDAYGSIPGAYKE